MLLLSCGPHIGGGGHHILGISFVELKTFQHHTNLKL
jgi:hypothetical protein